MPFQQTVGEAVLEHDYVSVVVSILASLALGLVIVGVYRVVRRKQRVDHTFPVTLVLLTTLIAMVTQVIGSDVARAFSLVGALSIVRFRTVVEDTLDIGFVIFGVVVGMAVGAGQWHIALLGTGLVGFAAIGMHEFASIWFDGASLKSKAMLRIRLTIVGDSRQKVEGLLKEHFSSVEAKSSETSRGGSALDVQYEVTYSQAVDPVQLVQAINTIEGVQSASLELVSGSRKG
jgi:energy-converting hydrogenase Eha subunit A